jgi:hypothetical protein
MEGSVSQVVKGGKGGPECGGRDEAGWSGAEQLAEAAVVGVDKRDGWDPNHAEVRGKERGITGSEAETAGEGFDAAPTVVENPQGEKDACGCGEEDSHIRVMRRSDMPEDVMDIKGQEADFEDEGSDHVGPGAMGPATDAEKLAGSVADADFIERRRGWRGNGGSSGRGWHRHGVRFYVGRGGATRFIC